MTNPTARNVIIDWVTLHAWDERDPFPRLVDNLLAELNRFGLAIVPRVATPEMIVEAMITVYPTVAEAGGVVEQAQEAARLEWAAMVAAAEIA